MQSLHVFSSYTDPGFLEEVRKVSERVVLHTPAALDADPSLIARVEVVFGGLSAEQMAQASSLRWLQTVGAGVDGLLTPAVTESELVVTNASGIHAEPITEHMFGMLLMVTRRLAEAWDQQKCRLWSGYDFGASVQMLAGKTLGVLGVGAIGGHSARVGRAFGMRVLGLRRTGAPHPDVECMYGPEERMEFLRECNVVMNSMPLTPATAGFLGGDELAALPPGAIVINTGRGGTIVTDALVSSLREGHLGAALLDVTDPEPLPPDHPLWSMERVYITPHYSGAHPCAAMWRAGNSSTR
jgi:D-2-hydroxyacid dehydrogenase (NADP+)